MIIEYRVAYSQLPVKYPQLLGFEYFKILYYILFTLDDQLL